MVLFVVIAGASCGRLAYDPAVGLDAAGGPAADPGGAAGSGPGLADALPPGGAALAGEAGVVAGPPDASAGPAPPEAAGGACPAALFCEDFETLALPLAAGSPYTRFATGGSEVGITEGVVRQGRRALRVLLRPDVNRNAAAGLRRAFGPVTDGSLYVRTHVRVGPGAPPDNWLVLLELQAGSGDRKISADATAGDRLSISANVGDSFPRGPPRSLPRTRWICLELLVNVADADGGGSVELFLDGASFLKTATGIRTLPSGGWARAVLGVNHISGISEPLEVVFDDFVLARTRLGCQ